MSNLAKFIKNPRRYFHNLINEAKQYFVTDKKIRRFIKHNQRQWQSWKIKNSEQVILVDLYGVSETLISYSYFLNVLARKHKAVIKSFEPRRIIPNRVLHKTYQSFNVADYITPFLKKNQKHRQKAIFKKIIPTLKTKQDFFDLKVLNIWIGIDVYETYLRRFSKPTIYLDDPELFDLLKEAIGLVIFWQDYFSKNQVKGVIVSHDCYLKYNIIAKVAYKNKVPVYLPNIRGITLSEGPFSVHSYFPNYSKMFKKLPRREQERGIRWAERQLKRRLKGEVGVDMPYATRSAFKQTKKKRRVLEKNKKIKVLICTHCFYDNPQAYGKILFVDFYEWLYFLGRISEETNYDWYLKVHPDYLPGTMAVVREILSNFPKIKIIPPETSHHQLVQEDVDFVLTAYGTVGHEYPLLGVQVINAGYNPHIGYDFNWHPKSIKGYEYLLMNLESLEKKKIDKRQVYEFYYMHYDYTLADDLVLDSYRQMLRDLSEQERIGSEVYDYFLNQWSKDRHKQIIKRMEDFIESGKKALF